MVQAFYKGILCPNKHLSESEVMYNVSLESDVGYEEGEGRASWISVTRREKAGHNG